MAKGYENVNIVEEDDAEIEALIQRELDALGDEDLVESDLGPNLSEQPSQENVKEKERIEIETYEKSLNQYLDLIKYNQEKASQTILESQKVLFDTLEDASSSMDMVFTNKLRNLLEEEDSDADTQNLLQLREEALSELHENDSLHRDPSAIDSRLTVALYKPDLIQEIAKLEEEESEKLQTLIYNQEEEKKSEAENLNKMRELFVQKEEEFEVKRIQRLEELEKNLERFKNTERNLAKTDITGSSVLKEIEEQFQAKIRGIEAMKEKEEKEFLNLKAKIDEERAERRLDAILLLQKVYRGCRARKMYGWQIEQLRVTRRRLELEKLEEMERAEKLRKEVEERRKLEEIEKKKRDKEEEEKLEKEDKERTEKEKLEKESIEKEKLEKKRIEKEKLEKERIEKEKIEKGRKEKERIEKERIEKEKIEKERIEKEKIEKERIEKERIEKERIEKERIEKEKIEKERIEKEKIEKERIEKERIERERKEKERIEKEKIEKGRKEKERIEKERIEKEKLEKKRKEKERMEKEKTEKARVERYRIEKEMAEREKIENERIEEEKPRIQADEKGVEGVPGCENEVRGRIGGDLHWEIQGESVGNEARKKDVQCIASSVLTGKLEEMRRKWLEGHTKYRSPPMAASRGQPSTKSRTRARIKKSFESLPELDLSHFIDTVPEGMPSGSWQCISINGLAGIRLKGADKYPELKVIQMSECGLEAIESIENCKDLEKLDLPRNKIESVNVVFESTLRHLSLPDNCLSSTIGFEQLVNLEYLDLSSNRITRVGSIASCRKLQTLILSENQLISLKGIEVLHNLTVLEVARNHLGSAKEVENLPLLTKLDLHSNTINTIMNFSDNVLLGELDLHENNLANVEPLSDAWFPLLEHINLAGNSIEEVPMLDNLIAIKSIDLRENIIRESSKLLSGVIHCKHLEILRIAGNPVVDTPNIRSAIEDKLPSLQFLDQVKLNARSLEIVCSNSFEELCIKNSRERGQLTCIYNDRLKELEKIKSPYDYELAKLNVENTHRKDCADLLLSTLKEHEDYGMKDSNEDTDDTFEEKLQIDENANASESIGETADAEVKLPIAANDVTKVSERISEERLFLEKAIEKTDKNMTMKEELAAIKIQAAYRGYRVRRILFSALEAVRQNYTKDGNDDDDDEFNYDEEVDLTAFEFDEGGEWRPSDTPQLPARTPALPASSKRTVEMETGLQEFPRHAWQSLPRTPNVSVTGPLEPLNLDLSPEQSDIASTAAETVASKKEEILMEWGFQNTTTADLMIKRAKKMNAANRKKNFLGMAPDKRYELFKKLQQAKPNLTVRPPAQKKTNKRVEYFSAQREANSPASLSSVSTERDFKDEMTYSWVCNQAVLHSDAYHDIISDRQQAGDSQKKSSSKSNEQISLPYMDPAIIAGKNLPLVLMSSRGLSNPSLASAAEQRKLLEHVQSTKANEKSRSAPNPSVRSPPVLTGNGSSSSRSSSSDSRRRKKKI